MLADNLTQIRNKKGLISNGPTVTIAQTKQASLNRQINEPLGRVHSSGMRSGAKLVYHDHNVAGFHYDMYERNERERTKSHLRGFSQPLSPNRVLADSRKKVASPSSFPDPEL
ncbi:hypothetical protein KXX54_009648 [Aspergillus fumigatus]|nr:hypothetical protein KXX54_009648 [Aspergillus fumigatus]